MSNLPRLFLSYHYYFLFHYKATFDLFFVMSHSFSLASSNVYTSILLFSFVLFVISAIHVPNLILNIFPAFLPAFLPFGLSALFPHIFHLEIQTSWHLLWSLISSPIQIRGKICIFKSGPAKGRDQGIKTFSTQETWVSW